MIAQPDYKIKMPEVKITPSRYRNAIGKFRIRRSNACIACGQCLEICPYGVYQKGRLKMALPKDYLCVGFNCNKCIEACPEKALTLDINPASTVIGDKRWTPDLLISTWYMAETGRVPPGDIEYKTGDSNGGFDRLEFKFQREAPGQELDPNEFSTGHSTQPIRG